MTDLAQLKMSLPFRGRSGSDKKRGCCPRCGANCHAYRYPVTGRWKHCYSCGYDRLEEKLLRGAIFLARQGRIVVPDTFERVVRYHDRVYGQKEENHNRQPDTPKLQQAARSRPTRGTGTG